MTRSNRKKIFISYSRKDKKKLDELKIMLKGAFQDEVIQIWDDSKILPGENWEEIINKALSITKVTILLVTKNFIASDFIMKNELPFFLNMAKKGLIKIGWIYWGYCNYEETGLNRFQALNDVSQPLDKLSKPEREAKLSEIVYKVYLMREE